MVTITYNNFFYVTNISDGENWCPTNLSVHAMFFIDKTKFYVKVYRSLYDFVGHHVGPITGYVSRVKILSFNPNLFGAKIGTAK